MGLAKQAFSFISSLHFIAELDEIPRMQGEIFRVHSMHRDDFHSKKCT